MDLEEGDEIRDSRDRKRIRKMENRRHRKIDRGKEKIVRENDRTRARRGDFREIKRATEIERHKRNWGEGDSRYQNDESKRRKQKEEKIDREEEKEDYKGLKYKNDNTTKISLKHYF